MKKSHLCACVSFWAESLAKLLFPMYVGTDLRLSWAVASCCFALHLELSRSSQCVHLDAQRHCPPYVSQREKKQLACSNNNHHNTTPPKSNPGMLQHLHDYTHYLPDKSNNSNNTMNEQRDIEPVLGRWRAFSCQHKFESDALCINSGSGQIKEIGGQQCETRRLRT